MKISEIRSGAWCLPGLSVRTKPFRSAAFVHFRDGREGGDVHGADFLAGEGLGAAFREMLVVVFADLRGIALAARGDEVAVVRENRPEEVIALHIVGARFEAQPALEAPADLVLKLVVLLFAFVVFAYERIDLFEVLLDDPSVDHEVADDREFAERLDHDDIALEVFHESIARQARHVVNNHCAGTAHALKARALPGDPVRGIAVGIGDVVSVIDAVQDRCDRGVHVSVVIENLPVRLGARPLLS